MIDNIEREITGEWKKPSSIKIKSVILDIAFEDTDGVGFYMFASPEFKGDTPQFPKELQKRLHTVIVEALEAEKEKL